MFPLTSLHVFCDREMRSAAENMAIDEALLETVVAPSLRFYCWRRLSLSFGYFGKFEEAATVGAAREMVRRWTGGGIVLHGSDLTYSVILPGEQALRAQGSRAIYTQIHEALRQAINADVTLALADAPKISDACFANPVVADVLANGRKIAGAAQRRTRVGLLHQGSIQYESVPDDFENAFAAALCPHFARMTLSSDLVERARLISERKYGTAEWLHRR